MALSAQQDCERREAATRRWVGRRVGTTEPKDDPLAPLLGPHGCDTRCGCDSHHHYSGKVGCSSQCSPVANYRMWGTLWMISREEHFIKKCSYCELFTLFYKGSACKSSANLDDIAVSKTPVYSGCKSLECLVLE